MTAEEPLPDKGWVYIEGATKWHFLVWNEGGRTLCGRWLFMGGPHMLVDEGHNSMENCKACRTKRDLRFPDVPADPTG